jgi:hypothetical protein
MHRLLLSVFIALSACTEAPPAAPPPPAVEVVATERLPAAGRSPRATPPPDAFRIALTVGNVHYSGGQHTLEAGLPGLTEALRGHKALLLRAAADVPYEQVAQVLGAAASADLRTWFVETRQGALPFDPARSCIQPATAPKPCTTTWALVTPKEIFLQNRSLAEVGCDTPFAIEPMPTAPLPQEGRGRCRRLARREGHLLLGIISPHIDRHNTGDRCDMATLSAWPEVAWGDVVAAGDALRTARHPRVALGITRDRSPCPAPPAPESDAAPASAPDAAPASAPDAAPVSGPDAAPASAPVSAPASAPGSEIRP